MDDLEQIADALRYDGGDEADYNQMLGLFAQTQARIRALNADPNAFIGPSGGYDAKMIAAFNGLLGTATKIVSSIHRMRNTDRFLTQVLEAHTKQFAGRVAEFVLAELRDVISDLQALEHMVAQSGPQNAAIVARVVTLRERLEKFCTHRILSVFVDTAERSMTSTVSRLGLK